MAFCGVSFSDETKEEDVKRMGHDVEHLVAFSSSRKQMSVCSQEGLLMSDEKGKKDRRIKIDFSDINFQCVSFNSLCQLKAKLPNGEEALGSCTCFKIPNGKQTILTCAHNLVTLSTLDNSHIKHQEGYVYAMRQGKNNWWSLWELDQSKIRVHPKFDGSAYCGFDIGTCTILRKSHKNDHSVKYNSVEEKVDCGWKCARPKDLKPGMTVEVAGYPGEKKGNPYFHSGKIKHIKKTTAGGWLLYYDLDTTPGNSGSHIQITDADYVKEHAPPHVDVKKITIGVHTGNDAAEGLNFGTLITPALERWIEETKVGKISALYNWMTED